MARTIIVGIATGLGCLLGMTPVAKAAGDGLVLPPMRMVTSLVGNQLYDALRTEPLFAALDDEQLGSPLVLRVTHAFRPTASSGAAEVGSAIWSSLTLGILPVVTTSNLELIYDVLVNGTVVASHSFTRNFTDATNIYAMAASAEAGAMSPQVVDWILSTVPEFVGALTSDSRIAVIAEEYQWYFPEGT